MVLRTENLVAGYGNKRIIDGITLSPPAGKITALLGPNGCGKSTLLKCFSRLLMPQSGTVQLAGKPLTDFSTRQLSQHLSLLPQQHQVPEGITVKELIGYGRSPWLSRWGRLSRDDHQHIHHAMTQTGTEALAHQVMSQLSGGQRQRVFLAMILAQDTPIVLLDEPTTYLDINHQVELMALLQQLRQAGKTVVAVLHDLNQASRYCDHLVLLAQGKIMAQGDATHVMQPELLERIFHIDAEIHPDPVCKKPMCIIR